MRGCYRMTRYSEIQEQKLGLLVRFLSEGECRFKQNLGSTPAVGAAYL